MDPEWTGAWACTWPPPKARRGSTTYRGKSEEGDANEGEGRGQEPPVPGLGVLVPVTNGRQGDLWKGRMVSQPGLAMTTVEATILTWTLFLAPRSLTQRPALRTRWTGTQAAPPTSTTRGPVRPGPTLPPFIPATVTHSPDPSSFSTLQGGLWGP